MPKPSSARVLYVESAGVPLVVDSVDGAPTPEITVMEHGAEARALEVVRGCWIRSEPRLRADKVGMTGRDGLTPCVERGPMRGSYYAVRCGRVEAWLHQKCVR